MHDPESPKVTLVYGDWPMATLLQMRDSFFYDVN